MPQVHLEKIMSDNPRQSKDLSHTELVGMVSLLRGIVCDLSFPDLYAKDVMALTRFDLSDEDEEGAAKVRAALVEVVAARVQKS
jgi:hypothetical protein